MVLKNCAAGRGITGEWMVRAQNTTLLQQDNAIMVTALRCNCTTLLISWAFGPRYCSHALVRGFINAAPKRLSLVCDGYQFTVFINVYVALSRCSDVTIASCRNIPLEFSSDKRYSTRNASVAPPMCLGTKVPRLEQAFKMGGWTFSAYCWGKHRHQPVSCGAFTATRSSPHHPIETVEPFRGNSTNAESVNATKSYLAALYIIA